MNRLAIYPGSFDPPTLGHIDLIERASKLFDEIIVAVGRNSTKAPMLTPEDRVDALEKCVRHLSNVKVEAFSGLLVDFVGQKDSKSIVRGLRAISDFEYEFQLAMVNRKMAPDIETVFLMTRWEYSYLSSSIVREVATLGGDFSQMVPQPVTDLLNRVK